jgi:hypothetical protein
MAAAAAMTTMRRAAGVEADAVSAMTGKAATAMLREAAAPGASARASATLSATARRAARGIQKLMTMRRRRFCLSAA